MEKKESKKLKIFKGVVSSDKMDKTIVVVVERVKTHPRYGKQYKVSKKYKVHDPENVSKIGDTVEFITCRPLSRDKKWRLITKPQNKEKREK